MAMKAEEALAIAKSYTKKSLEGQGALKGEDGFSPVITENTNTSEVYKLDITTKNGKITTPNLVGKQGLQGEQGEQGKSADNPVVTENANNTEEVYKLDFTVGETVFTTKNIIGKQGLEGVSPSVTTNPDNTAEDYRLNITTKGGTFTTPNLRGPQGEIGPQGESAASAINPRGDYDANAEPHYTISDYITSAEGNTYVCKKDNPNNVEPTDGTVNDEFWQVLALRGAKGESGKDGEKGADGVTFTPSIDANGVLSFTNNGGLENPEPIDIKGDNGVTFTPSIDADGYLSFTNDGNLENPEPIKVLGKDGEDGKDGIDGTTYIPSIGTVTTVESNADASAGVTVDEETKEAVFNFAIPKGENGADGFSPIITVAETDNGHNVSIEDVNGVQNFEVLDGKNACFTSLSQLGLTAPTTVGEAFMAMPEKSMLMLNVEAYAEKDGTLPTVTDIPAEYGVLTIDKWSNSRFRIEFNNSLGGSSTNVKQWIGTLKGNDGTGLKWKQVNTGNHKYTTMAELALDGSTATIQDVMDKVAVGDSVMIRTDAFNNNNWQTQCNGIQWGYLKIEKTMNGLSNIELQEVITPNRRYFGTQSSGKFVGWVQMNSNKKYTDVQQLGLTKVCSVVDIYKALPINSEIICASYGDASHQGGYITGVPSGHGVLEIKKFGYDGCRSTMTFTESATHSKGYYRKWVAEFATSAMETESDITWHEVVYKTVADVGFTTINQTNGLTAPTGITMTDGSKVNYCIRNGICYVHIALQISSISAKVNSWTPIAELPKSVIEAVGAMNCESNTVPECMPIRVSQAGKLTLMYKGTTTSTSDWWSYSFSYPVTG